MSLHGDHGQYSLNAHVKLPMTYYQPNSHLSLGTPHYPCGPVSPCVFPFYLFDVYVCTMIVYVILRVCEERKGIMTGMWRSGDSIRNQSLPSILF